MTISSQGCVANICLHWLNALELDKTDNVMVYVDCSLSIKYTLTIEVIVVGEVCVCI